MVSDELGAHLSGMCSTTLLVPPTDVNAPAKTVAKAPLAGETGTVLRTRSTGNFILQRIPCWCLVLAVLTSAGAADARNPKWARPLKLEGAPNLHQVTDGLYRSAQPTAEGFRNLKKLGVRTVVNLRAFHSDVDELDKSALNYVPIPMVAWYPEEEEVIQFLKLATNPKLAPVVVHCQHGADRTGTLCAVYRIVVQGWTKDAAIEEMQKGGYGFHAVFVNLERYLRKLDVGRIRARAGLAPPQ